VQLEVKANAKRAAMIDLRLAINTASLRDS